MALIAASGLAALGLVVLAWRRYVLGRRGQGQPLLWHGRAIIDDGGDDAQHDLSSIREEDGLVGAGLARAGGGKAKAKATLWHGAGGGGGAAGGGGPGAEAMRLRLEELRSALYLLRLYLLTMAPMATLAMATLKVRCLLWLYLPGASSRRSVARGGSSRTHSTH